MKKNNITTQALPLSVPSTSGTLSPSDDDPLHSSPLMKAFVDTWEEIDTEASGFIEAPSLTTILMALPPPMGVKGLNQGPRRIQEVVQDTDIPLR